MQIDDAINAGIALLQRDEFHDGAEVIAEMQTAGRLNPGKNQLLERHRAAPSIARGSHATARRRRARGGEPKSARAWREEAPAVTLLQALAERHNKRPGRQLPSGRAPRRA